MSEPRSRSDEGRAPPDDVATWNLLHDGSLVALERPSAEAPDDLVADVEIGYLRERLQPPGRLVRVRLGGCTLVEHTPYDGAPSAALDEIAAREPDVVEAVREEDDAVRIWGSLGSLRLRYRALSLALDDGTPLPREALAEAARTYWDDWRRRNER